MSALPHPVAARPPHVAFWRGLAVTLRPYLMFVSGATGLVGLALVPEVGGLALWAAAAAFFASYGLGQAVTDVFQTDTDALSSPYRPLVRGEIRRGDVLAVSLAGLALCGVVFALMEPWTLPVVALAVLGLVVYTPLKRRWWGGPPWNSWIVATLPVVGVIAAGGTPWAALARPGTALAAGSAFGTYAVFVLLGYLKDVEADRATGYHTVAVRFGRRAAVVASAAFLALGAACSASLASGSLPTAAGGWVGAALWVAGLALLVGAHIRAWAVRRDDEAWPAIAWSVTGYVALHLGEAALLRPGLAAATAVAFALSLAVMALRPCREQV